MKKPIAILGAGGHGKVVADIAQSVGWNEIVFFDDVIGESLICDRWRVEGTSQSLEGRLSEFSGIFVGIGSNSIRREKLFWLKGISAHILTLVHPSAVIGSDVKIGVGSVVMPGVVVNIDTKIGMGVILNTRCSVDHDCDLGDGVHIGPSASLAGSVKVGAESFIGIGASIKQQINVGSNVTVGAGAAVVRDLPNGITALGVPARQIC